MVTVTTAPDDAKERRDAARGLIASGLFWVLLAALLAANVIVAIQSLTVARLWEDEAYNLTVPMNLLAGYGYSSDGTLYGSQITPFDPRISTGPSVLLPVAPLLAFGLDPVLAGRLIPLAYWTLLLVGLYLLASRLGGRWAGLLAAAVPLAFNTTQGNSPIQGPADLLGEIPAAAFIVWALLMLPRRAWLAGLFLGLAVQAKLIALLALPAFAVALWVLTPGRGWAKFGATFRRAIVPLVLTGAPMLVFEIAALMQFGFAGYPRHLRGLGGFILQGGQSGPPTTLLDKFTTLFEAWFLSPWFAVLCAVLTALLVLGGLWATKPLRQPQRSASEHDEARSMTDTERRAILAGAAVGLAAFVLWWATASHLPLWVRHPAPGVFAFLPLLAAGAVWGFRMLRTRHTGVVRVLATIAIALVALGSAASGALHAHHSLTAEGETLQDQRAAALPLQAWVSENNVQWLAAHPWGPAVPMVLFSGSHIGLWDAPTMTDTTRLSTRDCEAETLVPGTTYRICTAP